MIKKNRIYRPGVGVVISYEYHSVLGLYGEGAVRVSTSVQVVPSDDIWTIQVYGV